MERQTRKRAKLVTKLGLRNIYNPAWKVINDESFEHGVNLIVTRYNRLLDIHKLEPHQFPPGLTTPLEAINVINDYYKCNNLIYQLKLNRRFYNQFNKK